MADERAIPTVTGVAGKSPLVRPPFLSDRPLQATDSDHLSTFHYVALLQEILLASKSPLTIGLFGTWGKGKSTIIEQLHARLRSSAPKHPLLGTPLRSVVFDAWKYEGDALRRQLILAIHAALQPLDAATEDSLNLRARIYQGTQRSREVISAINVKNGLLLLAILLVSGVFSFVLASETKAPAAGWSVWLTIVVVAGARFAEQVLRMPGRLVEKYTEITRGEVIEYPEEFEGAFKELVKQAGALVVCIDNLDRCEDEKVIEVLRTVKTFLEPDGGAKTFFVIACDQKAVERHVRAGVPYLNDEDARDYAREYLRKLFNAQIDVLDPSPVDFAKWVESLLDETWLGDRPLAEKHTAAQLIVRAVQHNPRRVIQFINRLSAKLLLVRERQRAKLLDPALQPDLATAVCACAIEEQEEDLAIEVGALPQLWDDLRARLEGRQGFGLAITNRYLGSVGERDQPLVRLFADVSGSALAPLLTLRRDDYADLIANAGEFQQRLIDGDADWAVEQVREEPSRLAGAMELTLQLHTRYLDTQLVYADAVAAVAGQLALICAQTDPAKASAFSRDLLRQRLREVRPGLLHLFAIRLDSLGGLVRTAPAVIRQTIGDRLIDQVGQQSHDYAVLSDRLAEPTAKRDLLLEMSGWEDLDQTVRTNIGDQLGALLSATPAIGAEALDRLLDTESGRACVTLNLLNARIAPLLTPQFFATWSAEPSEVPSELRFIAALRDIPGKRPLFREGAFRVIGLLANAQTMTAQVAPIVGPYLLSWLAGQDLAHSSETEAEKVALLQQMHGAYASLKAPARSAAMVELLALATGVGGGEEERTLNVIRQGLEADGATEFMRVLRARYGSNLASIPSAAAAAEVLMSRFRSASEDGAAQLAIELAFARAPENARAYVTEAVKRGRFTALEAPLVGRIFKGAADAELEALRLVMQETIVSAATAEATLRRWVDVSRAVTERYGVPRLEPLLAQETIRVAQLGSQPHVLAITTEAIAGGDLFADRLADSLLLTAAPGNLDLQAEGAMSGVLGAAALVVSAAQRRPWLDRLAQGLAVGNAPTTRSACARALARLARNGLITGAVREALTNGFEQFAVGQDAALEAALADLRVALEETAPNPGTEEQITTTPA